MKFLLAFILTCQCFSVLADTITIAVASNFRSAMNELINEFEAESGHEVLVSYGSSGRFFSQINNGAPFDAFFSADQEKPALLETADQEGEQLASGRFTYAIGALALWSKSSGLQLDQADILRQGGFNKLSIANPRLAPYGAAALEVLAALGLEESSRDFLVQGENVTQAYQFVDSGNAELGFVALSQVMSEGEIDIDIDGVINVKKVEGSIWLVPAELHSPIRQDAVLLKRGQNKQAVIDFLDYVKSEKAKMIIQSYGYRFE